MNLVKTYVSNIANVEKIQEKWGDYYKLTADIDCYGRKEKQKIFTVNKYDHESIMGKGYYMT